MLSRQFCCEWWWENNTILEAEVDRRQLQVDNILGAHTITGGSMNKIKCPGPSLTIAGGSFNSITNRCEYSTIVGGTGKSNVFVSFFFTSRDTYWFLIFSSLYFLLLHDLSSYTHTCMYTQLMLSKVLVPLLAQVRGITFL